MKMSGHFWKDVLRGFGNQMGPRSQVGRSVNPQHQGVRANNKHGRSMFFFCIGSSQRMVKLSRYAVMITVVARMFYNLPKKL